MDWVGKTCLKHYLQSIALILLKYLLSMEKKCAWVYLVNYMNICVRIEKYICISMFIIITVKMTQTHHFWNYTAVCVICQYCPLTEY